MKKIVVRDDEDLSFFKSRLDGDIQFYILFIKGEPYLVDTQGYDYARYIVRIVGAGEELSVKFSNYVEYTPYAKGGKVKSNNNEMIIGGLAGILFGFLLNK